MAQFNNRQHIAACMAADPHRVMSILELYVDGPAIGNIEADLTPELTPTDRKHIYLEVDRLGKLDRNAALTAIASEELRKLEPK